jgi:hypothetical protein
MQKQVGLWIDHRKAVITTLIDGTETTREVLSNLEKRVRFSSSSRSNTPDKKLLSVAEDTRDRQFENQLDAFYTQITSLIKDASAIWIIGSGEAKLELEKFLKNHNLADRIAGVEPADKLTNRQIASKVRQYFKAKKN